MCSSEILLVALLELLLECAAATFDWWLWPSCNVKSQLRAIHVGRQDQACRNNKGLAPKNHDAAWHIFQAMTLNIRL